MAAITPVVSTMNGRYCSMKDLVSAAAKIIKENERKGVETKAGFCREASSDTGRDQGFLGVPGRGTTPEFTTETGVSRGLASCEARARASDSSKRPVISKLAPKGPLMVGAEITSSSTTMAIGLPI